MYDENKVHANEGRQFHAQVSAKTFWLHLGDLRRLVAAAEHLPDTADVTIWGTSESARSDERYIKTAHVRHTDWTAKYPTTTDTSPSDGGREDRDV